MAYAMNSKEMEPLNFKTNFYSIWYRKRELSALKTLILVYTGPTYKFALYMGHTQQNIAFLKTVSSQSISVQFTRKAAPMKAIQAYGGVEVYVHEFLTLALDGNE